MTDLISKIKMIFDTIISFFQALNFVKKYFKKDSKNKKDRCSNGKDDQR